MYRSDLDAFQRLMVEVQECYGHRPPSAAVLQHWADALNDHPFHTVDAVLRNWIRTKQKPPVIADIATICAGIFSDKVEQRAIADKRAFGKIEEPHEITPFGRDCIRHIHAMLAKPKRPSKEWARKIMENPRSTHLQREFAAPVYRTMGESDQEPADEPMPQYVAELAV